MWSRMTLNELNITCYCANNNEKKQSKDEKKTS